jgi:hypothetical protein
VSLVPTSAVGSRENQFVPLSDVRALIARMAPRICTADFHDQRRDAYLREHERHRGIPATMLGPRPRRCSRLSARGTRRVRQKARRSLHDLHSEERRNTIGLTQAVMMVSLDDAASASRLPLATGRSCRTISQLEPST